MKKILREFIRVGTHPLRIVMEQRPLGGREGGAVNLVCPKTWYNSKSVKKLPSEIFFDFDNA